MFNPDVDRLSTAGSCRNWQSTETLQQYMREFGLCDVWRSHHPTLREYTFFSSIHHSYSRLDHFLISSSIMRDTTVTQIHPITIIDHAPVSFTLTNAKVTTPTRLWRFTTSPLEDQDFINFFKQEWALF